MDEDIPAVVSVQMMGCGKCEMKTAHSVKYVGDNPHEYKLHLKCQICGHEKDLFATKIGRIGLEIAKFWGSDTINSCGFPILKDNLIRIISIGLEKKDYDRIVVKVELR